MATTLRELIVSVSADTRKYQSEMQKAGQQSGQFFKQVKDGGPQAARSWDHQTSAVRHHSTALEASRQAVSRYALALGGIFGAGKMIGMADEWTQINARLKLATASTAEFEQAQTRLEEIAGRTYRRFNEAAEQFAQTARPMQELGFATRDTLDSAEALGLALVAGGSNAQKGATAIDAWGKSIAQGKIATEQFQTLLLQTPRVAQALADGLGKTTSELTEMARAGQLTAQVAVPALVSQMGKLRAEADALPVSVEDASIRFRDALQKWAGGANEASGATQTLIQGIELVTTHIDTLATLAISGGIGLVGSRMILAGKDAVLGAQGFLHAAAAQKALTVARVADAREAVVANAMRAQELVSQRAFYASMMATATSQTELSFATRRHTMIAGQAAAAIAAHQASIRGLDAAQKAAAASASMMATTGRAALGILGGPAGLAISVGLVAAGWLTFGRNTERAESELANWTGTAAEAVAKFRELNAEIRAGNLLDVSVSLDKAEEAVRASFDRMTHHAHASGSAFWETYVTEAEKIFQQFDSGAIGVDAATGALARLNAKLAEGSGANADVRDRFTEMTAEMARNMQQADRQRGIMALLTEENRNLESATDSATGAMARQATQARASGEAVTGFVDRMNKELQRGRVEMARMAGGSAAGLRQEFGQFIVDQGGVGAFDSAQLKAVVAAYRERREQLVEMEAAQKRYAEAAKRSRAEAKVEVSEQDKLMADLNESYADQVLSLERQIALHGEVGRSAAMAYDLANGSLSHLAQSQKDYLQGLSEWLDWLDDTAALEGVWAETAKEHGKYADDAKNQLKGMEAYADQAARNMQSALGDNLYNILDGKFSGIADSFGDMLKRMAAELMASQIWQALGSALAGYGGQGGWGNFVRGVGGAMQGGTKGGRAGGGPVAPFSAYDVTEHGDPELLSFGGRQVLMMGSKGGMVTPLMNKAGGGAGGAPMQVIVNNNVPAKVNAREERSMMPDGSMLRRLILDVVAGDTAEGGKTWQATRMRGGLRDAV